MNLRAYNESFPMIYEAPISILVVAVAKPAASNVTSVATRESGRYLHKMAAYEK